MKPVVNATYIEANVFECLGAVTAALRAEGYRDQINEVRNRLPECKSHDDAIAMMQEYVVFYNRDTGMLVPTKSQPLPAGRYVVADPCYILQDNIYDNLLGGDAFECEAPREYADGNRLVILHTKHGDGQYHGNDGKTYLVDSGTIACIAIPANPALWFEKGWEQYPQFTVDHDFRSEVDEDGFLNFGDFLRIQTGEDKCEECHGNPEYCTCDVCGGCTNYGCTCDDEEDEE